MKIIAAGDDVPITKYANQVVAKLAKLPGYPGRLPGEVRGEHRLEGRRT